MTIQPASRFQRKRREWAKVVWPSNQDMLRLEHFTLNVDGGESFKLPRLTFSPKRGEKITVKIDGYLRDTLSA